MDKDTLITAIRDLANTAAEGRDGLPPMDKNKLIIAIQDLVEQASGDREERTKIVHSDIELALDYLGQTRDKLEALDIKVMAWRALESWDEPAL